MTINAQLAASLQQSVAVAGYTLDALCQQLKLPGYRHALRDVFGGAAVYAEWRPSLVAPHLGLGAQ